MTLDQLRAFGLAAVGDVDARIVLEDAFRELDSIVGFRTSADAIYLWFYEDDEANMTVIHVDPEPGHSTSISSETAHEWLARAIAAAILFGEWPESWPLTEDCRVELDDEW